MNKELFIIMVPVPGYTSNTFSLTYQTGIYIIRNSIYTAM